MTADLSDGAQHAIQTVLWRLETPIDEARRAAAAVGKAQDAGATWARDRLAMLERIEASLRKAMKERQR